MGDWLIPSMIMSHQFSWIQKAASSRATGAVSEQALKSQAQGGNISGFWTHHCRIKLQRFRENLKTSQDCQVQLKLALGLITVSKIFKGSRGKHWTGPVRRCEELNPFVAAIRKHCARSCRILPSNWLQNQVLVNANDTGQQQSTNCRAKTKQSLRWRCPAKIPEPRRLIGDQRMVKPSCSHQRPKCPCQEKKRHLATTSTMITMSSNKKTAN